MKQPEDIINEQEEKCSKRNCRENEKKLIEIEKENKELKEINEKLDQNLTNEYEGRLFFLKEMFRLISGLYGSGIFNTIFKTLELERKEAFKKAPKIKDEKGEEVKCATCKNPIVLQQDLDKDIFKASDGKWYCFDDYRNKYFKEFETKLQKFYGAKFKKERKTEIKLNGHTIFEYSIEEEVKMKDVSVIFFKDKTGIDMCRTIVKVGEDKNKQFLTNQIEVKDIDTPKDYYDLELFIDGKLIEKGEAKKEETLHPQITS